MKVLNLDIEGGFGGSSRSLFEFIDQSRDSDVQAEVWHRKDGPVHQRYQNINIPCHYEPDIPHISSLPRFSRNLVVFGQMALFWKRSKQFRLKLLARLGSFDVLHLNHEGLFLLAAWLRPHTQIPITVHVRTHLPSTIFSRWQYRLLSRSVDKFVFITENERANVEKLVGKPLSGQVIYNIARPISKVPRSSKFRQFETIAEDTRFKVCVLSNYSYMRGIDQLVDVAEILKNQGLGNIAFVIAGDMALKGSLPGNLGPIAKNGGSLADYAAQRQVGDMFHFLGHVGEPEAVLAACDVLAKPTREANPWGRDILEALAAGKPVLTVGTYDRFVENGVTGIITAEFDPVVWAAEIKGLAEDRQKLGILSKNAELRIADLCSPQDRTADLVALWAEAIESSKYGNQAV